ncbi:penicillin acylase family protein [Streptomyces sp. GbtcB6]|uniref:penicillin acylase family protein n=1 Tax=Streptomyces sp. GbtcB6 TaxID=2824751 RepID=UPI001C30F96A|nr:penicillin acylase family protein [Streptomyces sp. GbtcB6]
MTIETYRDAWGIPHLRAADARELARAQGRVTAHDRAWQLEVERHRAQGTSASFLGTPAVAWDVFARRARLADTARRCFEALERRDPETAEWVRAYVAGVNEGLPAGAARTPEFARTGLTPGTWEPWHPLAIWLATHILFAGFPAKLWREEAIRHLGEEAVPLFATDGPTTAGSNGWLLAGPRTTTGHALLAGDPHRFIEAPGVYQQIHLACPEFDVIGLAVPGVPGIAHFAHTGTVAWSITNAMADYQDLYRERLRRTVTGVEALAPDGTWTPAAHHTETIEVSGNPPVRIEVLETPRGPVIAGGPEGPGTGPVEGPGTGPVEGSEGLEAGAAVGLAGLEAGAAVGPAGLETRAVEAAAGTKKEATGAMVTGTMEVAAMEVAETADVLDRELRTPLAPPAERPAVAHAPAAADGGRPPRGPLAPDDESRTGGAGGKTSADGGAEALALRYPPRVTEDLGFSALLPLLRARHVTDVDRAFDAWAEPVNVVHAADTAGGLLHRVAGRVPVRSRTNRTRLAPAWLPGHDWQGWHEMPYGDITDGVAVMANQRGPATPLGVEFAPPHRADRIRTLLGERRTWSAADMPAIHTDTHLASATPLLDRLAALDDLTPEAGRLRDRLLAWDRRMDADSTGAAAYAAVRSAVVRHLAAHPAFAALTEPPARPEVLLPWLALTPRIAFALEHLLRAEELYGVDRPAVVRAAVEDVAAGRPTGTWGDTHRLTPWQALPEPSYDDGPALSGDHDCVLCTSAVPGLTDRSARGPAARYVWDLAHRDDSRWVVPLGADGVPGAPHHTDQLPLWLKGDLAPVVTDWDRLERVDLADLADLAERAELTEENDV